jgi:Thioredoxin.
MEKMTDVQKQLEAAAGTGHLVLVVFYADWSPHYEWIGPVLRTYEERTVELIRVNTEENGAVADARNVETVPTFLLLHKGHELWRQVGELTVEELKDVLDDFR